MFSRCKTDFINIKLTKASIMVGIRKKTGTNHPDDPGRDADDQQETDV